MFKYYCSHASDNTEDELMSDIEDMQKENDMDDNEPLSGGGGGF